MLSLALGIPGLKAIRQCNGLCLEFLELLYCLGRADSISLMSGSFYASTLRSLSIPCRNVDLPAQVPPKQL
jgi:hypothetical protein